ncbi:MAG: hypothetical protein IJY12_05260 [Clostridia bacterium]|nr:hypothetical protein [Clostridia bacterium]
MYTETKEERFALCNPDGKLLYVSEDMLGRINRPLDGANIKEFLDSLDQARFDGYRFSGEARITFTARGVRGLGALMLERSGEGLGLMFRCHFACRQGDLPGESRQIRPDLFRAARRELAASREAIVAELSAAATDGARLAHSVNAMYRNSMLLLLGTEFFFGKGRDKEMRLLMPFLREVTDCVTRWVRHVDIDICLNGDENITACYEDSSFVLALLAMLSVLNDISSTHRVELRARGTFDGAYLTLKTESALDCPDFDLRPIGYVIFAMPEAIQMRMHLCDVVSGAYGYGIQCAKENGCFTFAADMPHVRRGRSYLKEDPFVVWDTEGICRRYFDYLFSDDGPR